MLPGAALSSLAARFCWQGQHFRLWTVPERVSGPPPSMLPGAALSSLAARFCWQGQHFRLWTVPERVSGPPPRCCQAQHFRASAGRGLWTVPERVLLAGAALQALDGARARFGAPALDAARRSTSEPRGSFLLAGAALQALDGARARFGAPPLDAARRSTSEPRGSFLLAGAALQALDGARARFPPLDVARRSTSEPRLVSAGRGSTSGSGRCRARFGAPPLMLPGAALLSLAFLLAGAALQALDGTRARFGAPHTL